MARKDPAHAWGDCHKLDIYDWGWKVIGLAVGEASCCPPDGSTIAAVNACTDTMVLANPSGPCPVDLCQCGEREDV